MYRLERAERPSGSVSAFPVDLLSFGIFLTPVSRSSIIPWPLLPTKESFVGPSSQLEASLVLKSLPLPSQCVSFPSLLLYSDLICRRSKSLSERPLKLGLLSKCMHDLAPSTSLDLTHSLRLYDGTHSMLAGDFQIVTVGLNLGDPHGFQYILLSSSCLFTPLFSF